LFACYCRFVCMNGYNIAHVPYWLLWHIQDYVTQHVIGAHTTGLRSPNHVP
jgi:hypothetical protein